jgi:molecular chaperone GrpE
VPIELAQKLKEERDRFAAELEKARRTHDRLNAELDAERVERDAMQSRLDASERQLEELRAELELRAAEPVETVDTEVVKRLSARVEELTSDLERVQRRTRDTVDEARRDERVRILAGLGDVLDSVERALEMGADGPWRQGLIAIRDQLFAFMRVEGATITGAVGQPMDPRLHEAIAVVSDSEYESGEIVSIDRHGIELEDGTVARAAQVHVAA